MEFLRLLGPLGNKQMHSHRPGQGNMLAEARSGLFWMISAQKSEIKVAKRTVMGSLRNAARDEHHWLSPATPVPPSLTLI
jgi:hypothetical protein